MRVAFRSNHHEREIRNGRLVVQLTREDDARGLSRFDEFFFNVPSDYHVHNDLVATALLAIIDRTCTSVTLNFPISQFCAEQLTCCYSLDHIGPVDPWLEPRQPGRYLGLSFSGGLDSVGVWSLLHDVAQVDFKVITGEFEGFHREAVGYASYHRDVSCWTNFRKVLGDVGHRLDACIPLLFADYADLSAFITGHVFGSGPGIYALPDRGERFEFLDIECYTLAGGLPELHLARCLHTSTITEYLVVTAPQRVEAAYHASDGIRQRKGAMKGLMLQHAYRKHGLPLPPSLQEVLLPVRPQSAGLGLFTVWTWRFAGLAAAKLMSAPAATAGWPRIAHLSFDFFARYCPYSATLIPADLRATILAGLEAAGLPAQTPADYDELATVRDFCIDEVAQYQERMQPAAAPQQRST